jgi:hypothetical protein
MKGYRKKKEFRENKKEINAGLHKYICSESRLSSTEICLMKNSRIRESKGVMCRIYIYENVCICLCM